MDPFTIITGTAGLLDAGFRVSKTLSNLIHTWRHASADILDLHNEVVDLTVILHHVQAAKDGIAATTSQKDAALLDALTHHFRLAQHHLRAIERLAVELYGMSGKRRKFEWLRQKSRAQEMKSGLRAVRIRINDILLAHNVLSNSRVELQLQDVQAKLCDIGSLDAVLTTSSAIPTSNKYESKSSEERRPRFDILPAYPQPLYQASVPQYKNQGTGGGHSAVAPRPVAFVFRNKLSPSRPLCKWRSPLCLQNILGALFIAYSVSPVLGVRRSYGRSGSRAAQFEATYIFPAWFVWYTLHLIIQSTYIGPSLGLTLRRRYEFASNTLLHAATMRNPSLLKSCLFREPWSVNAQGHADGRTALAIAVEAHTVHRDIIRMLLRAGADPDIECDGGATARAVAAMNVMSKAYDPDTSRQMEEMLQTEKCIEDAEVLHLSQVIVGRRVGDVRALCRVLSCQGIAAFNTLDGFGLAPIHYSIMTGNVDALLALLQYGADVNLVSHPHQISPIYLANIYATTVSHEIICILLDHGADQYITSVEGFLPLQMACFTADLGIVKSMISAGFDVNRTASLGRTVTHTAARFDRDEVLEFLLSCGAKFDVTDERGQTPLLDAVRFGGHKCLRVLLKQEGFSYVRIGRDGNTILHAAAEHADEETMAIMSQHGLLGVDTGLRNKAGKTAAETFWEFRGHQDEKSSVAVQFEALLRAVEGPSPETESNMGCNKEGADFEEFFDALEYPVAMEDICELKAS